MTKEEMKDRISMALKDPTLQQGFEIICKNLSELEKENAELKENIENLEGIKLSQGSALETEYMINESLKEEKAELKKRNGELAEQKASLERWLGEAKGIIRSLLFHMNKDTFSVVYETKEESISKAETFLEEEE